MEMMETETILEPTPEVPETIEEPVYEQGTAITITFSFGDNNDWFVFEQQSVTPEEDINVSYDFNFDNVWA
jgi:hypothetical protein